MMKHSSWLPRALAATVLLAAVISGTCWAAEDVAIADFKKNPLPADWQVEGYAFGSRKPGPRRQQAAKTTANQRQYQTGKLTSPGFTIERDYLLLEIGGVYHPEKTLPFYHGRPYYAAQTFSDTPGRPPRRIQVGWQSSQVSFPIELSLRTTPVGVRLCSLPVNEIANLYQRTGSFDGLKLSDSQANPLEHFESGLYDTELDADVRGAKQMAIVVRGKAILYDVEKSRLSCEQHHVTLPPADGRLRLRVIVDHCSIDIHAGQHGAYYMPMFFGPLPPKRLELRCEGGPVTLDRLRVHELKPIWKQEKPS